MDAGKKKSLPGGGGGSRRKKKKNETKAASESASCPSPPSPLSPSPLPTTTAVSAVGVLLAAVVAAALVFRNDEGGRRQSSLLSSLLFFSPWSRPSSKWWWGDAGTATTTNRSSSSPAAAGPAAVPGEERQQQAPPAPPPDDDADPATRSFVEKVCRQPDVRCHGELVPSGRTQAAAGGIPKGEIALEIPRRLLITDLDAMRSEWIRGTGVMKARMPGGKPLSGAAFLAVHLARLIKQHERQKPVGGDDDDKDGVLRDYLTSVLPTYKDYESFHPALWGTRRELERVGLGPHTSTFDAVAGTRESILREYEALRDAAPSAFFDHRPSNRGNRSQQEPKEQKEQRPGEPTPISLEDYLAARLSVQTRAFGTGPQFPVPASELELYRSEAGVDLSAGCFAMVPILDLYDHHANPHVAFKYEARKAERRRRQQQQQQEKEGGGGDAAVDADGGAFVVKTIRSVPPSFQVFDSYGKRTDSDLFARYGFVNGDGTDYTEASLALFHRLPRSDDSSSSNDAGAPGQNATQSMSPPRRPQLAMTAKQMVHYLQYDDGYERCISPSTTDEEAWKFKVLKFKYLLTHSHLEKAWVVQFGPRNKDGGEAHPPPTSDHISYDRFSRNRDGAAAAELPSFDPASVRFDATSVFSTCRLMSLTHRDYGGRAAQWLEDHMYDPDAVLPQQAGDDVDEGDVALEFRTLMGMARLSSTAISRFGSSGVEDQLERVAKLQRDSGNRKTREWTIQYLILGEMQGLHALKQVAFSKLRSSYGHVMADPKLASSSPPYYVRDKPCPKETLRQLVEDVLKEFE